MKILLDTNVLISAFIVHGVCSIGDKDLLVLKRFDHIDIVSPSEFSEYEAMKQAG
jgi:predicted nucleic acid-binding protein